MPVAQRGQGVQMITGGGTLDPLTPTADAPGSKSMTKKEHLKLIQVRSELNK